MENSKDALSGFTFAGEYMPANLSRLVLDVQKFLDTSPAKKLFTSDALAVAVGRTTGTLNQFTTRPALAAYRHTMTSRRVYWGSKATIKELKRRLAEGK